MANQYDPNAPIKKPRITVDKNGNQIDAETGELASTTLLAPGVSQAVADIRNSISNFASQPQTAQPDGQSILEQRIGAIPKDGAFSETPEEGLMNQIALIESQRNANPQGFDSLYPAKKKELDLLMQKLANMKALNTPLKIPTQMAPLLRPE